MNNLEVKARLLVDSNENVEKEEGKSIGLLATEKGTYLVEIPSEAEENKVDKIHLYCVLKSALENAIANGILIPEMQFNYNPYKI